MYTPIFSKHVSGVLEFCSILMQSFDAMKIVEFAVCVVVRGGGQVVSSPERKGFNFALESKMEFPALSPPT